MAISTEGKWWTEAPADWRRRVVTVAIAAGELDLPVDLDAARTELVRVATGAHIGEALIRPVTPAAMPGGNSPSPSLVAQVIWQLSGLGPALDPTGGIGRDADRLWTEWRQFAPGWRAIGCTALLAQAREGEWQWPLDEDHADMEDRGRGR